MRGLPHIQKGVEVYSDEDERLMRRLAAHLCDEGGRYGNGTLRTARRAIDFFQAEGRIVSNELLRSELRYAANRFREAHHLSADEAAAGNALANRAQDAAVELYRLSTLLAATPSATRESHASGAHPGAWDAEALNIAKDAFDRMRFSGTDLYVTIIQLAVLRGMHWVRPPTLTSAEKPR